MLRTHLTDTLGLRYPIIGAPLGGVAGGLLAGAISRAGGLGMIPTGKSTTLSFVEAEAAIARGDDETRFGFGIIVWALEERPDLLDAVIAERPALLSLSFGSAAPYVDRIHQAGIMIAAQVNSVAMAREAVQAGVDLIVAQGTEAGGHSNSVEIGTLTLLQAVLESVEAPVLAAGGIATPRGLAAVLAAGAAGAWVGTAFLASPECTSGEEARRRIIAAHETDTVLTSVFDRVQGLGWPAHHPGRALRNRFVDAWHGRIEELVHDEAAAEAYRQARAAGSYDTAVIYAGEAVGLVTHERPAGQVVRDLGDGAEALLRRHCRDLLT